MDLDQGAHFLYVSEASKETSRLLVEGGIIMSIDGHQHSIATEPLEKSTLPHTDFMMYNKMLHSIHLLYS